MSKSYKKNPIVKDRNPRMKKYANRKFRRTADKDYLLQGGLYKKNFESWDISDQAWTISFEEFCKQSLETWEEWEKPRGKKRPTEKELWRIWYLTYKGK